MTSDEQVVEHLELLTTGGSNITYIREGIALIKRLQAENERLHFDYERLAERKPVVVSEDARLHLAWLMWCFNEGYVTPYDREILENWMGEHQDNAEDERTRQSLLAMADEVLAALR